MEAVNVYLHSLMQEDTFTDDYAMHVIAQSSRELNSKVSRLLRVKIADLDDNVPDFRQDSEFLSMTFEIYNHSLENSTIGKVLAVDLDNPPYNSVYYYLLPSCDNRDSLFGIDRKSGRLFLATTLPSISKPTYTLCILASSYNTDEIPDIQYRRSNQSMTIVEITVRSGIDMKKKMPAILFKNATTVTIGAGLSDATIPMNKLPRTATKIVYKLTNVKSATMSANEEGMMHLFTVNSESGDILVDPNIDRHEQGVYSVHSNAIESKSGNVLSNFVTYIHYVHDDSKLKYVFQKSADNLGANLNQFYKVIRFAIKEGQSYQLEIDFDQLKTYNDNVDRSEICFHMSKNSVLLDKKETISLLSNLSSNDSLLARVYKQFAIINIELCSPKEGEATIRIALTDQALWWATLAFLALLLLAALASYLCFLTRYKEYLRGNRQIIKYLPQLPRSQLTITDAQWTPRFPVKNQIIVHT